MRCSRLRQSGATPWVAGSHEDQTCATLVSLALEVKLWDEGVSAQMIRRVQCCRRRAENQVGNPLNAIYMDV